METVELVMACDERFGIEIPDMIAAELLTPRHVPDGEFVQDLGLD